MEHLPTPFTAEQIRDACRGRRWWIVTETPDAEPVGQITEFVGWDDAGATMRVWAVDAVGTALDEPTERRTTWEDLRRHALFPADRTEVAEERIVHPLGELETRRYTLSDGERRHVFWFATAYPGMPVRYQTTSAGVPISTTTVVESTVIAP